MRREDVAALSPCPGAVVSMGENVEFRCFPRQAVEANSTAISLSRGVQGGWWVFEARGSLCDHLGDGMLKSLDLRTNRIRSQVDKTFAGIAASVDLLVGIQEVGGANHPPRPLFLSYPQSFTLLLLMPVFERSSVHSVQLRATQTRIRTVLPRSCGIPRPL